mgnify:CR=1 FL=1
MKKFWLRTAAVVIAVCMLLSANAYAADGIETQNFYGDVTEAEKYGAYCVIPEGTKEIPDGRYTENNFDNLILNEGLESIGSEAFVNDLPFFGKYIFRLRSSRSVIMHSAIALTETDSRVL